jgi:adenylate kinase family enzyme
MRVVVIGCSGAGKTTLARAIAGQLSVPHIEHDAIKWQPGWRDIEQHDPDEYTRRLTAAIQVDAWVLNDGSTIAYRRATHLVWLDYSRRVVMARVIWRSVSRALLRTKLWGGNRERWCDLLRAGGPIRWAWRNWSRRRRETAERLARGDYSHLAILRLRRPGEVRQAIELLAPTYVKNAGSGDVLPAVRNS